MNNGEIKETSQENKTRGTFIANRTSNSECPLLSIFVACYNESQNIEETLLNIENACSATGISYEVILIDDASTDNSVEIVKDFINKNPHFPIVFYANAKNQGLGANFGEAAFLGRGTYYRLVCGDNVEPAETLIKVFSRIGEADIILCYYPNGVEGKTLIRRCISGFYTALVNFMSGYKIRYYNGLPIFKRYDVMRWNPNSHGFGFQADLVTRLLYNGASYIEIPVRSLERKHGKPKAITFLNFCSVLHSLMNILIRRLSKIIYGK
jgi:glycosyltransferase involved in cell wall biosynthesis